MQSKPALLTIDITILDHLAGRPWLITTRINGQQVASEHVDSWQQLTGYEHRRDDGTSSGQRAC